MLEHIRRHRNIYSFLMAIGGVALVLSMIGTQGNPITGGILATGGYAAKVEGEKIFTYEVEREFDAQLRRAEQIIAQQLKGMSPEQADQNRKFYESMIKAQVTPANALEGLIQQKFRSSTAKTLGLHVPDSAVRNFIAKQEYFQTDSKFDPLLYKQRVPNPSLYENYIRDSEVSDLLNQVFEAGLGGLSPLEKIENQRLAEQRQYETVEINPMNFGEAPTLSDADVDAFANNTESAAKLTAYYDKNASKYKKDEQVHARHILIKDEGGGEAKAKSVLADIAAKKITFEEAAKQYSTDASNASKGGDLGFFGKGVMDPAFEKASFALAKDGDLTTAPVKSSFGWHLIERVAHQAATTQKLDDVKKDIARLVLVEEKRRERAQTLVDQWLKQSKGPGDSDLKANKLSWTKQREWSLNDSQFPGVGRLEDQDLAAVLKLNADSPFLSKKLFRGDSWVLVKWRPLEVKKDAKKDAQANSPDEGEKIQTSFNRYMEERRKKLEADKVIVKNDKILQELQARIR